MTSTPPQFINPSPSTIFNPASLAATVNVDLSLCPDAINGVLLGVPKTRVLLAGQSVPAQNGIYEPAESGSGTDRTITASQTTTESATAGRLVWVSVTGTVTVTGANGSLTGGQSGFLAPLSGPTRFDITGGASGGVATFKTTVALVRTADADANGDFLSGKTVDVRKGTNAGVWALRGPVSPLVLTNSLAMTWIRQVNGNPDSTQPAQSLTASAPALVPLGFSIALWTSFGPLMTGAGQRLTGLI